MGTNALTGRRLGFIGAGNMAEALAKGVLAAGVLPASAMAASDPSAARRSLFEALGIRAAEANAGTVAFADVLVLAVKPQAMAQACDSIRPHLDPRRHLAVSIAAGVPTSRLEVMLGEGVRIVRVMPNTPMLVGAGASCICGGKAAREEDLGAVEAMFSCASLVLRMPEPMMDAVTGLSGSGPAYAFYLVEAMVEAGVAEGMTREQALALSRRTVLGAAKMLEETGLSPEELRRRVTSPGGTTQAAMERLEADGVKAKIAAAIRRAAARSRELGRGPA